MIKFVLQIVIFYIFNYQNKKKNFQTTAKKAKYK